MCSHCGKNEIRFVSPGKPQSGKCPRRRETNITFGRLIASLKIIVGEIDMSATILKAVVKTRGAKNAVKIATSKSVRELGKKIVKHEIKKRLK